MRLLDLPPFRPHPWVKGPHMQTLVGTYAFRDLPLPQATLHRVPLEDGDRIVLHDNQPQSWRQGDPAALMLHGLGGCSASPYVMRICSKLFGRHVRTFRMDLRGCGAGFTLAAQPHHAGRSEDAAAALKKVVEQCPASPVTVIGVSLSGNMVLKMAAELGATAPPQLAQVIAVCPPIDILTACESLRSGAGRFYDRSFVNLLMRHLARRRRHGVGVDPLPTIRPIRCLYDFDEMITAPLSGFRDALEYYTRSSAAPLLPRISVPTTIIAAEDDPVIPVRMFEAAKYSDAIRIHIAPGGGHIGFVAARNGDADRRWLEWRILELVETACALPSHEAPPVR